MAERRSLAVASVAVTVVMAATFIYAAEVRAHNVRCKCGTRTQSVRPTQVEIRKCRVSTDHALTTCAASTCNVRSPWSKWQ